MRHQPFTILLHIALAVILAGAIVTHFYGIQGRVTLHTDSTAVARFEKESGPGTGEFPFSVSLDKIEIDCYPATTTPMDFRSVLLIDGHRITVAMNKVGVYQGWRFYQSGIGDKSSTLSVSHDPWGTGITYGGYILLGLGMTGFFFQSNTPWRSTLRKYRRALPLLILISASLTCRATEGNPDSSLPAMQRPLAANFGKILVYWNDRICPLQTMADDVTATLYGGGGYKGYTPEQVLSGWLFYYDQWQRDYLLSHPELKSLPPYPVTKKDKKEMEKLGLIRWIGTGEIFRIYPYRTTDGHIEWLSLTGRRPSGMKLEQWQFMQTAMPEIKQLLMEGKNIQANKEISKIMERQREFTEGVPLPSPRKIEAERSYNRLVRPALAGIMAIAFGLVALLFPFSSHSSHPIRPAVGIAGWALLLYIAASLSLLWWISGHIPLSNGPETMMFMALVSLIGVCCCRDLTLKGALLVVAAMSLLVTAMGGRTPRIGAMMPVLASPLLSIHVMVVMISYSLFFMMAILAAISLSIKNNERRSRLSLLNRILLTPAVCLLGAGIFIGAVWANQTWGRYWGWDPKETCALVMWLIYALPVHWGSRRLAMFRKEKVFNIYILAAILSVIFTYFGANYFLSGLHSYA